MLLEGTEGNDDKSLRCSPEHVSLVTGANFFRWLLRSVAVHGCANLGGLTVELVEDLAGLVVQALLRGVEADLLDGITDDRLVVDGGVRGDLTEDHHETSACACLTGDAGFGVLREASVDDGVGYLVKQADIQLDTLLTYARPSQRALPHLVRELVRVSLIDGLGSEKKLALGVDRHCGKGVVLGAGVNVLVVWWTESRVQAGT